MAKTLTKSEAVFKAVKRGPKRGLTALEIADRTGVGIATVRSYLQALKAQGEITVVGKVESGKRGRPQLKYIAA